MSKYLLKDNAAEGIYRETRPFLSLKKHIFFWTDSGYDTFDYLVPPKHKKSSGEWGKYFHGYLFGKQEVFAGSSEQKYYLGQYQTTGKKGNRNASRLFHELPDEARNSLSILSLTHSLTTFVLQTKQALVSMSGVALHSGEIMEMYISGELKPLCFRFRRVGFNQSLYEQLLSPAADRVRSEAGSSAVQTVSHSQDTGEAWEASGETWEASDVSPAFDMSVPVFDTKGAATTVELSSAAKGSPFLHDCLLTELPNRLMLI